MKNKILFWLVIAGLVFGQAFATSEKDIREKLEAYMQKVAKNFPSYFFGDKNFINAAYLDSNDLVVFEVTLFANVNYVIGVVCDDDLNNMEVEGAFGFDYPQDNGPNKENMFPFVLSFLKKNQYSFSVPVTGTYKLFPRL